MLGPTTALADDEVMFDEDEVGLDMEHSSFDGRQELLASKGVTEISKIEYVDRGYENIEEKLRNLGARIERVNED